MYFFGAAEISKILGDVASDLATYFSSIMLAGSVAFLWTFYSKSDTPFSKWLYESGAFNVYLYAYVVTIVIYAVLLVLLLICSKLDNLFISMPSFWFLILGLINVHTFVSNVVGQLQLNMEFNRQNDINL